MSHFFLRSLVAAALAGITASSAFGALSFGEKPSASAPGLTLPGGLSLPSRSNQDFIIAIVNKELVTNSEVKARVQRIEEEATRNQQTLPPRNALTQKVVDTLINERAQLTHARDSGVKIDEAEIDRAVQNIAEQNQVTVAQLTQRLKSDGMSITLLRNNVRDQLLVERVREQELQSRVRVSEAEVNAEADQPKIVTQVNFNIAHLLVGTPNNASQQQIAEAQQRAQSLLKRALAGESFETLVSKNSDAERNNGGAIGLRSADRLPEPFVDAVQDLPIGGIAPKPLRSNAGFHLLKLLDKQTTTQTLPDVLIQNHARHILRRVDSQDEAEQAEKTFKQFKQQVEKGQADFATLARQHSQDGTAAQGGDLGWTTAGQFVPEFEATLDALHPGEIAQPFLSRFGMHLVQLLERKQTPLTREQKLDAARKTLKARKQEEAYTEWSQEILARAYVEHRAEPDLR